MLNTEDSAESAESLYKIENLELKNNNKETLYDRIGDLDWSNLTIMIAEDEMHSFMYLQSILIPTKVNIIRAKNGRESVELMRKHPEVSIILMDINMPVMNGIEATRAIKSFQKDIIIIAQTAFALSENEENCRAVGVDDFLTKPIRFQTLLNTLLKYI